MHHNFLQAAIYKDENRIISIYEAPTGLDPDFICICPICGDALIAKNKNKSPNKPLTENERIAHFAHQNDSECHHAGETLIHRLAKEILCNSKKLKLPFLRYGSEIITDAKCIEFESASSEERVYRNDKYKTIDTILVKDGKKLLIEFYKTHIVEENKVEFINERGLSCIEIDLNGINILDRHGAINKSGIKEFLENSSHDRYWLNNIKLNKLKELKNNQVIQTEKQSTTKSKPVNAASKSEDEFVFFDSQNVIVTGSNKKGYNAETLKKWRTKLKSQGYIFKKIYKFRMYEDDYSDSGRYFRGYSHSIENIYCPLLKNSNEKTIEFSKCEKCQYYKARLTNDEGEWSIACNKK